MVEVIGYSLYIVVGLMVYLLSLTKIRKFSRINYEDLFWAFLVFGVLWPLGWSCYMLYTMKIPSRFLNWINEKLK